MKIIATHLLNDFSGSPKVLKQLLSGWLNSGYNCTLFTASKRNGFLSDIKDVDHKYYYYRWTRNRVARLLLLVSSQVQLFFQVSRIVGKSDIVYVNTIYPFGAALAGRFKGCRVIYHLHETSIKPNILKWFLFSIAKKTATDIIYVSKYLAEKEVFDQQNTHVLYNALDQQFLVQANQSKSPKVALDNVLMVCSLKDYKGVREFVELAKALPLLHFKLVLNASLKDINEFFDHRLPTNLNIFPTQNNIHPFYQWSDIVLNLSHPNRWVETFGLTIIEGMAYGNPAIVPEIGGITELVFENQNGYKISCHALEEIKLKLTTLRRRPKLYKELSQTALSYVSNYQEAAFITKSINILNN